nr:MAG TPA: hypothetical protein [Crassvirales sp.]
MNPTGSFMNSFVNSAVSFRNTSSPLGTYFRLSGTVFLLFYEPF